MHSLEDGPDRFEDLKITGVDKERTYNPDPSKLLYHVYLQLSDSAPSEWSRLFDEARSFPRHSLWRRAWCEGDHIVIHCPVDEVEMHHLADLKQDVVSANEQYREASRKYAQLRQRESAASAKERGRVDDTLDRLKFN